MQFHIIVFALANLLCAFGPDNPVAAVNLALCALSFGLLKLLNGRAETRG